MRELHIGDRVISDDSDCFVIAEIGHNHQGDLETAKKLFVAAKESGVDAVKLQKRDNKFLYTQEFYDSIYNSENAYGPTYGLHREALEFGEEEYRALKDFAAELGLIFFATPFDTRSVDFLESLDMPCYKVASGDLTNTPLLEYIAHTGKPVFISTGAAEFDDVRRAYETVRALNSQLALLQCTATYPADFEKLDLNVITTYRSEFPDVVIGLSSHDNGIAMGPVAYVLGARIIEKHFTLNRAMKGTDHAFSLEPVGMRKIVRDLRRTRVALGDGLKKFYEEEQPARYKMGKKIVASRDLPAGHVLEEGDLHFKSPGDGLPPYRARDFYGKALKTALQEDEAVTEQHV